MTAAATIEHKKPAKAAALLKSSGSRKARLQTSTSLDVPADSEPIVGGEAIVATTPSLASPRTSDALIGATRETHRQRNDFVKAEGNLQRQIKAICRRAVGFSTMEPADIRKEKMTKATALFDALEAGTLPEGMEWVAFEATHYLVELRDSAAKQRAALEKSLKHLAKQSHVAHFVEETPGFGLLGLAQIIGEAGDLAMYANPAKLWKRMGLGLISSGERQQRFTDKNKAIEAGYSPRRRSVMFVLGDSMIKSQGPYRELYLKRKEYERVTAEAAGLKVLPAAKIKVAEKAKCRSEGHVHIRAQRYMEKRLLRDLWRVWRGQVGDPSVEAVVH